MNTLWGPYKLSGATSQKIKERIVARQHRERSDTMSDGDQGNGKRLLLSVLPTIAEHVGSDHLSKSLGGESKVAGDLKAAGDRKVAEWDIPSRPASPDSILERAESDSPSSSGESEKSEDLDGEQVDTMEEIDLIPPTSPGVVCKEASEPSAKLQAKGAIWSPAPVCVRPFCPEFWSKLDSPTNSSPSSWASLDSPPTSSKATGVWATLPTPPSPSNPSRSVSPEPLPLSPISSPSSSPPPVLPIPSIFASVPNNAPSSRSMQAGRVPVLEREFSFKLGVPSAEPLPAASAKHFTRSLSVGAQATAKIAAPEPVSSGRALGRLSSFPSAAPSFQFPAARKLQSLNVSPVGSPRGAGITPGGSGEARKHFWCWRCGQRADLPTKCLVCTEDFAVCRGCAHERAAKGRRPDTCLCGGCMSRPIDPAVIERVQKLALIKGDGGKQSSGGGGLYGSGQKGPGGPQINPPQHCSR